MFLASSLVLAAVIENDQDLAAARQKAEILYERITVFERLARFYLAIGLTLLAVLLVQILGRNKRFMRLRRIMVIHLLAGFGVHTLGIALHWYVTGHTPWSNLYGTLIITSWASMLAGILFLRGTALAITIAAFLSWMILHTAHMDWMVLIQ
jgi:ABC-type transport system involved in cytochrome c biogenesis permease subunit